MAKIMILNWLNNENAVKANLLIELGFFYNGMTDDSDNDPNDLIEIINEWSLYFEKDCSVIHAVIGDDKFTYSLLDNFECDSIEEIDINLDSFFNKVKMILSSYHNGSNDQLSLNLA
jgi:hypothetical protein